MVLRVELDAFSGGYLAPFARSSRVESGQLHGTVRAVRRADFEVS